MVQLKQVGVLSLAKVSALVHGAIGLLFVPLLLIVGGIMATVVPGAQKAVGGIVIVEALVIPFFYAGVGFLLGAFVGWIYNFIAGKIGGIEVEFGAVEPVIIAGAAMSAPSPSGV
jgi:hypothetical protein